MADRVGTSGWSYDEWTGPFYPEGTAASARLAYYARRLGATRTLPPAPAWRHASPSFSPR